MTTVDAEDEVAELVRTLTPGQFEVWFANLPPSDRRRVTQILADRGAIGWRADPASFAAHLDPNYRLWPYVRYLSDRFVDVVEGRTKRLAVAVPPRYGKSLLFSRWGPAWLFDRRPEANIILASYGDALALENAMGVRDLLAEHADRLRVQLRRDRKRMDRFATEQGGGLLAAGMNSAITGFGAGSGGGVIVDDPFKGWQDAHSPHQREAIWNNYRSVLHSRLDDSAAFIIVVHTRWHTDDLTGRLIEAAENETGDPFEVVVLPELAEQNDPLGRAPGEALEEDRFTREQILDKHRAAGAYLTSALYQGHPSPEEGTELLRQWWRLGDPPERMDEWLTSWDMKLKEKETGDYTVGQVWGRVAVRLLASRPDPRAVGSGVRPYRDGAPLRAMAGRRAARRGERRVRPRGHGAGPPGVPVVGRARTRWRAGSGSPRTNVPRSRRSSAAGLTGVVGEKPTGSKVVRARAMVPLLEAGNVHLNQRAVWLAGFMDEAAQFPDGEHDDQVDAWSQGLKRLSQRSGPARVETQARRSLPAHVA